MEVENVSQLLDYVFDEKDLSLDPQLKEYKKLQRIMGVMIRFYEKGARTKKEQLDKILSDLETMNVDENMIKEQLEAIKQFPDSHPKKLEYLNGLEKELSQLEQVRKEFTPKAEEWRDLYEWSEKIVEIVNWLGRKLEEYSNAKLGTTLDVTDDQNEFGVGKYKLYKRGLEEITYNLQESQDFFDASLDGRLKKYHQIERCMIEAQLSVIRKFPEDSPRRYAVEEELLKDLEYLEGNMKDDPDVTRHRQRMRDMHQDFFTVLKWQREKLLRMPFDHPEMITGDVESLVKELENSNLNEIGEELGGRLVPDDGLKGSSGCPVDKSNMSGLKECPVTHNKSGDKDFSIHRLY